MYNTKVKQYNNIYRWDKYFNTTMKQNTVSELKLLLNSSNLQKRDFVIKITKELINFKIARQQKDIIKQEKYLDNLTKLCENNSFSKLTVEELMQLVRNQSYLYQRVLPTTFKNFLKSLQLTKSEIELFQDQQSFLSENGIKLNNSKERVEFMFDLYKGEFDSITGISFGFSIDTDDYKFNIWNIPRNNNGNSYRNNISGFIFTPNMLFSGIKQLEGLLAKNIPIIIVYKNESEIINYFLDKQYPFIKEVHDIKDIKLEELLQKLSQKESLDKSKDLLNQWLEMFQKAFNSNEGLSNAYRDFKKQENQENNTNNKQYQYSKKDNFNDNLINSKLKSAIAVFKKYSEQYNEESSNKEKININDNKNFNNTYKKLSLYFHPDKNKNNEKLLKGESIKIMQEINGAKDKLIKEKLW